MTDVEIVTLIITLLTPEPHFSFKWQFTPTFQLFKPEVDYGLCLTTIETLPLSSVLVYVD